MSVESIEETFPVITAITQMGSDVPMLYKQAKDLVINDMESSKTALSMFSHVRTRVKELDTFRKAAIEPSRKYIAVVNDAAKCLSETLEEIENSLKTKLTIWTKELERIEAGLEEASKRLKENLGLEVDFYHASPKTLSNADAIASTKIKKVFEVVDENLVPREYLMVNESKIKKALSMGIKNIPGINIKEEKEFQVRRRG